MLRRRIQRPGDAPGASATLSPHEEPEMSFGDGSFGNDTFSPKGGLVTALVAFGTALGCSFLVEQSVGALVGVWTAALVAVLSLWFYLQPDDVLWWLQTDHVVYRQPDYWWRREQGDEADAKLPMLALTIDDVPCGPTCCSCRGRRISDFPESLAILKKHGARATLFVMSDEIDNHPRPDAIREALKEAVDYGCELGNHSTVDEKTILLSEAKLRKSLDKCDAALRAIAPMKVTWFRPGGGLYRKMMLDVGHMFPLRVSVREGG